jgi:hypothetical protein
MKEVKKEGILLSLLQPSAYLSIKEGYYEGILLLEWRKRLCLIRL